jgi:tetratricopeptide (TPR) repeat protein
MKILLPIIFVLLTSSAFGQLSEKDKKRLAKYELLFQEGDIYSRKIKEDKLLEKYPQDVLVIDFSIRLIIERFKDSFNVEPNPILQVTSKTVRGIRYREVVSHLETVLDNDLVLNNFCKYYYFLLDYKNERPYDRPPTSFKEIYSSELEEFEDYCNSKSKVEDFEGYSFSSDSTAAKFYDKGYEAFNKGDFLTAISFYKQSVKQDTNFIEAIDNLALSYRQLNQLDSAKKYYIISLEKYPRGELAYQNLGTVYLIEKDYQRALYQFHQLSELNESNSEAFFGKTKAYLAISQYEQALVSGLRCEELYKAENNPYLTDIQYLLGITYYYKNNKSMSKSYLQMALNGGVDVPLQLIEELKLKQLN